MNTPLHLHFHQFCSDTRLCSFPGEKDHVIAHISVKQITLKFKKVSDNNDWKFLFILRILTCKSEKMFVGYVFKIFIAFFCIKLTSIYFYRCLFSFNKIKLRFVNILKKSAGYQGIKI